MGDCVGRLFRFLEYHVIYFPCGWYSFTYELTPCLLPYITPPEQYKKAKADKLDLVGEDQRRMLEYRKQVGRRARGWYTG